ncbi:MAG TPA: ABC transporter permease [Hyphomicrobiaceae bacterium]|jgi:ribose transport system permease protein
MSLTGSHPQLVKRSRALQLLAELPGAAYLLFLMSVLLSFATPEFFSVANLTNVALQVAVLAIVSFGMTLVILTEGIDLSLGPVLGLCGVVMGLLVVAGWPLAIAVGAALLIGAAFGTMNGILVAYVEMPPFIVTLGAFGIAMSFAMVLTEGNSVTGLPEFVRLFNEGVFLGIPVPIWATAVCFAVTYILLYHTKFGRYTFAIGGNRQALILSGSPARFYQVLVYAYAGALAAVGSFIMTARMNAAHPTIGVGLEFDAIAAVILGGTSFEKGRGGITGTVIGALAVGVLRNGLNLMGVSTEWQVAVVGIVIILAVSLDSLRGLNQ